MSKLVTLRQNADKVGSYAYWGERGDWLIAAAVHRDSDCLCRSNFRCVERALKSLPEVKGWSGEFTPVAVERFTHWAVGWVDYLVVDPSCSAAVAETERIREALEDYPVVDEEDFSNLEHEDADLTWKNCFTWKERVKYIREHRSQFEFRGCADILGCVRGNYFSGYASELLS
jgi:hypothetical protein